MKMCAVCMLLLLSISCRVSDAQDLSNKLLNQRQGVPCKFIQGLSPGGFAGMRRGNRCFPGNNLRGQSSRILGGRPLVGIYMHTLVIFCTNVPSVPTCLPTYIPRIHTYVHTYTFQLTYINTCIHTKRQTYKHTN
jgi:hypothetical protein